MSPCSVRTRQQAHRIQKQGHEHWGSICKGLNPLFFWSCSG
uniref:Uncharacterized protein n=1 Tax=Arundo donax TaxID=35708 RepID=A0A0A9DUU8_ARUDO